MPTANEARKIEQKKPATRAMLKGQKAGGRLPEAMRLLLLGHGRQTA